MSQSEWFEPSVELMEMVQNLHDTNLRTYAGDFNRVIEDARKESSIAEGGYGRKQIQELLQNAADAVRSQKGRIEVYLDQDVLYVANQGEPFSASGVRALLYAHLSNKSGEEIGRFGLGFKSISGVSNSPQIFSQSVSFGFDRERAQAEISESVDGEIPPEDIPSLRLAWTLDNQEEILADEVLRKLSQWAVTIIKVPLLEGAYEHLSSELSDFDDSFCLFTPHVDSLRFIDVPRGINKTFRTKKSGKFVTLTNDQGEESRWLVVSKVHEPSSIASDNAGRAAKRETVTVSWAVPMQGKLGVGRLTAFFPVKSDITLSGRLNAPWKLSDDRINVIDGAFNRELLEEVVPELVEIARPYLATENNFGRYLDALPARGRESRSWADEVINEPIYNKLRESRSLPNAFGELRSPNSLKMIPGPSAKDRFPESIVNDWMKNVVHGEGWVHPVCTENRERRAKAARLMGKEIGDSASGRFDEWLESLIDLTLFSPAQSRHAIDIASRALEYGRFDLSTSEIVLLENNTWVAPMPGICFIRSNEAEIGSGFINSEVTSDENALRDLQNLGITHFKDSGELYKLLNAMRSSVRIDWEKVWVALRGTSIDKIKEGFSEILDNQQASMFKVRTADGNWSRVDGQYLPGSLLKVNQHDSKYLLDPTYHAGDQEVLSLLGIHGTPVRMETNQAAPWYKAYRRELQDTVGEELRVPFLDRRNITMNASLNSYGPLDHFEEMGERNRAALTRKLLERIQSATANAFYKKQSAKAPRPEAWLIKRAGLIKTDLGYFPIDKVFFLDSDDEDAQLIAHLVPNVMDVNVPKDAKGYLGFKTSMQELTASDLLELVKLHAARDDEGAVGDCYAWWASLKPDPEKAPARMLVRVQGEWVKVARHELTICADPETEAQMEELGFATLSISTAEDMNILATNWGIRQDHEIPTYFEYDPAEEKVLLTDAFPPLSGFNDHPEDLDELNFLVCNSLSRVTAVENAPKARMAIEYGREGDTIYTTSGDSRGQLEHVLRAIDVEYDEDTIDLVLAQIVKQKNQRLIREIRKASDDIDRLLLIVGEARLRSLIPKPAMDFLTQNRSVELHGRELAEVAYKMYGESALEQACKVAGAALPVGHAPKTWRGTYKAREWVKNFKLDESWAGRKEITRNKPTDYVDGPTKVSEFHDYQQRVSDNLRAMITGKTSSKRGLITLPTGAGKTRVAVQTIISAIANGEMDDKVSGEEFSGPILWIVGSQELCEQAIDAWAYLWRAFGRQDTRLVLSRMWDKYKASEETTGVQVVVATFQTLNGCVNNPDFDWLKDSPLVIIDEAHSALAKSYTSILEWTGRTRSQRDKLLLGLSATPYRGRQDSEETERLHRRFDNNFLDEGVFGDEEPMVRLQNDRVLAHVEMEILRNDNFVSLSAQQVEEFKKTNWLPSKKAKELGDQTDRTERIIASIKSKPDNWSIIVFATSVDNADTLATLLTLDGIPARAISDQTNDQERARAIERFKAGKIRVLTNYNVLSQGFDAPKTDAVYITRPTTSEVRYLQMIGRGLRGPKNGGTENVLIVNLLDNIQEFDLSINYKPYEYLAKGIEG